MIDKEKLLLVDPDDVSELGAGPALVLAAIRSIPTGDGGAIHFSMRGLASRTGLSHTGARKALEKLQLEVLSRGGSSCILDRKKDQEIHRELTGVTKRYVTKRYVTECYVTECDTPSSNRPLIIGLTDAADA